MNANVESDDDIESDNSDGAIDVVGISDSDSLTARDNSRDDTRSTVTVPSARGANNSFSNYPLQYLHSGRLTIFPQMNGLNINPVFYTDVEPAAFIADDQNVASYQEVSTYPYPYIQSHPPPISLLSDIYRPPVPTYDGLQYPPPPITPLPTLPVNNPISHPVLSSAALPLPSSGAIHNDSPAPTEIQQPIVNNAVQATLQNEVVQQPKKRGRKRLSDTAAQAARDKLHEVGTAVPEHPVPKKRGRKRKNSGSDTTGKTNKITKEVSTQPVNDGSSQIGNVTDRIEPKKQCSEASNQLATATKEVKSDELTKTQKKIKKRAHKKTETKSGSSGDCDTEIRTSKSGRPSAAKKRRMEDMLQKQKNRVSMAFPKGTFLIRYSDLETLDCDQIWCVDNHHMLLKYRLSSHIEGQRRLYLKSQPERFIGWKCEEPWHFYELSIVERDRDGSKVTVLYPDAKELAKCREKARRQKQLFEEMKTGTGNSHNPSSTSAIDQSIQGQSFQQIVLDGINKRGKDSDLPPQQDGNSQQSKNMEVQMADEAANAIERFILIPDDDEFAEIEESEPMHASAQHPA